MTNNNKGEVTNPHKCEYCNNETLPFEEDKPQGCIIKTITIEGELRPRIPYTPPYLGERYFHCHDCGATDGRYHHPGCDMETCINCMGQLISCSCENINIHGKPIQLPVDLLVGVALRDSPCTICGTKPSTEYYPLTDELGNIVNTFWTCEKHSHDPKIEKDLKKGISIKTIVKKWNK
jgi:hypothetical protein